MKTILSIALVILILAGAITLLRERSTPPFISQNGGMQQFSSQEELEEYLKSSQAYDQHGMFPYRTALAAEEGTAKQMAASPASIDYSTTNIQVAGVDEADIVKNDNKYLYLVRQEKIIILEAYPAEDARVVSDIDINGYVHEIFINDDKLIVFGNERGVYSPMPYLFAEGAAAEKIASSLISPEIYPRTVYHPRSFIRIYDVSNKQSPLLARNVTTEGIYYDSRMIGDEVHAIFHQPVHYYPDYPVPLPVLMDNGIEKKVAVTEIYHPLIPPLYGSQYTNVVALDVNTDKEARVNSFLIDSAMTLYVSQDYLYLAGQKQVDYRFQEMKIFEEAIIPSLPPKQQDKIEEIRRSDKKDYEKYREIDEAIQEYMLTLSMKEREEHEKRIQEKRDDIYAEYARESQKTVIHKISLADGRYGAHGEIPGHLLNQFSMDEHKRNLRVTTTTQPVFFAVRGPVFQQEQEDVQKNHLYVLDEQLEIIGRLEDLAPGERIYSTRFMGDRAYMVTFKNVDPLFVLDVSDPRQPSILGKLKIPGYSDYLHPYDETTIIGLGKEAVESKQGDFALYQGMKLALFDVSDVSNPQEISKYNIGDRGTDSEALHEHKAFLFSRERNLLVLPITLAEFKNEQQQEFEYGEYTFQGAYVFNLDKRNGFMLKGRISHVDAEELLKSGSYPYFSNPVRRSLYIGNYLYTISDGFVKANELDDLGEVKTIKLPKIDMSPVMYAPEVIM